MTTYYTPELLLVGAAQKLVLDGLCGPGTPPSANAAEDLTPFTSDVIENW